MRSTAGATAVGSAVLESLAACRYDFREPQSQDEWRSVGFPIFKAGGLKSWASVAERAHCRAVHRLDSRATVLPSIREKPGFSPVAGRELPLEAPSDAQLGEAVIAELQRARHNEGSAWVPAPAPRLERSGRSGR